MKTPNGERRFQQSGCSYPAEANPPAAMPPSRLARWGHKARPEGRPPGGASGRQTRGHSPRRGGGGREGNINHSSSAAVTLRGRRDRSACSVRQVDGRSKKERHQGSHCRLSLPSACRNPRSRHHLHAFQAFMRTGIAFHLPHSRRSHEIGSHHRECLKT